MRYIFTLLLAASLIGCGGGEEGATARHAGINVLLLTVDALRPDHMSSYGYQRYTTPAIDAMATRGVVFDQAYTYWPKTRGSFAAMFTSLYASQHGLTVRDRDLPDFNQTLAEILQEAGYRTAAAIDNGNLDASLGFSQGFDVYEQAWLKAESEADRTEHITEFAVNFLKDETDSRPFFLWIHYVNPHAPYDPPQELLEEYRSDGLIPRGRELNPVVGYHGGINRNLYVEGENHLGDYYDRYDAEIRFADGHIGRVLEALEASRHKGKTLVVFTSDHGESLGEHDYYFDHGFDLFNPCLRIPLILYFPGIVPEGGRNQAAATTLDIFPTILDLAHVSFPPELQGTSLVPLLNKSKDKLHDKLLFQNDQHQMALSNGRLKLIAYPRSEEQERRYELYDTWQDPSELEDRYSDSESKVEPFRAELERLRTRTVAWQQETTRRRMGAPAKTDDQLSEETLKNLEALGYVGTTKKEEKKGEKK
jgi:arylsulfatase A-like enzyme